MSTLRTLVVIGGAKRIGEQCARLAVADGWNCFVADADARALADLKHSLGENCSVYCGDITSKLGIRNALSGVREAFGRADAVIHIPPIPEKKLFLENDGEVLEDEIIASARSVTSVIRLFAKMFLKQRDQKNISEHADASESFVQVFSMAALKGDTDNYSATASQSMALAASRATTLELASYKIRNNAIIAVRPRAEVEESWLKSRTPLSRHSHAEEIAAAAMFLVSSAASSMTGQNIVMDGGRTALNGIIPKTIDLEDE